MFYLDNWAIRQVNKTKLVMLQKTYKINIPIPISENFLEDYPYVTEKLQLKFNTLDVLTNVSVLDDFKSMCVYEDDTLDVSCYNPSINFDNVTAIKLFEKILNKHQYIDTEDIIVELDESLIDYIMFEEV
jgi:hypothetical protein